MFVINYYNMNTIKVETTGMDPDHEDSVKEIILAMQDQELVTQD